MMLETGCLPKRELLIVPGSYRQIRQIDLKISQVFFNPSSFIPLPLQLGTGTLFLGTTAESIGGPYHLISLLNLTFGTNIGTIFLCVLTTSQ